MASLVMVTLYSFSLWMHSLLHLQRSLLQHTIPSNAWNPRVFGDHDDPPASYHEFSLPNVKVDLCQDRFRGEVGRMMWYDFEFILAFSFIFCMIWSCVWYCLCWREKKKEYSFLVWYSLLLPVLHSTASRSSSYHVPASANGLRFPL